MPQRRFWPVFPLTLGLCLMLAAAIGGSAARKVNAAPSTQGVSNDYCLECHGQPDQIKTLPNGESLYLTIDSALYEASVHGAGGYACVQCHTDIATFPHPEFGAENRRAVTLQMYVTCKQCHIGNYERALDSVHQRALEAGNENAAVCADCHNPHYQSRLTDANTHAILADARIQIPQTCARCHSAIYDQYRQSVHGAALIGDTASGEAGGNPDVPSCIDCHGVHNIEDPTTASFRLQSPQLCAGCHTDPARMAKYGISTQVLETYLADFHGTTVTLFEKQSPDQVTNKPVCFDCHGIHNISRPDDPQKGLQVKENLLAACQRCHPNATPNFPDAWLSHYIPSPQENSLVYYVNVFYRFFIPTVLGGMFIFVASDVGRRVLQRRKGATRP